MNPIPRMRIACADSIVSAIISLEDKCFHGIFDTILSEIVLKKRIGIMVEKIFVIAHFGSQLPYPVITFFDDILACTTCRMDLVDISRGSLSQDRIHHGWARRSWLVEKSKSTKSFIFSRKS